ncbi:hypothetical protein RHMOL_Rhmol10G0161500 [Rhododendron molle]|uniref:Uncharacterized protein n=1 Tax=Rhododendron molle TaxID=49168 RepID=A0ACC0M2Y0_RHOML|nr:hypothetical protein RHMOL_Rhmol10G0161500 [Rhododendron molle]
MEFQDPTPEINEDIKAISIMDYGDLVLEEDQNLEEVPELSYDDYEPIKWDVLSVAYDSLTKEEFEKNWGNLINKYHLEANEWLSGLYEERHRWAPAFVKDVFWTGMSTTQRSESMNSYFDGYIHSNTTLKEFVEQYENALRKKVEKEDEKDARCFNKQMKNVSPYGFEDQFQDAYTLAKYKDFQAQVADKIACNFTSMKVVDDGILKFEIEEDIKVAVEKAMDSEAKSKKVVAKLQEAEVENEVCEEECLGDKPMSVDIVDEIISSEEKKIPVCDLIKRRRKGWPPHNPNVHTMELNEVIMQGSVNCSTSQMVGPHGGMWSYALDEASTNL